MEQRWRCRPPNTAKHRLLSLCQAPRANREVRRCRVRVANAECEGQDYAGLGHLKGTQGLGRGAGGLGCGCCCCSGERSVGPQSSMSWIVRMEEEDWWQVEALNAESRRASGLGACYETSSLHPARIGISAVCLSGFVLNPKTSLSCPFRPGSTGGSSSARACMLPRSEISGGANGCGQSCGPVFINRNPTLRWWRITTKPMLAPCVPHPEAVLNFSPRHRIFPLCRPALPWPTSLHQS